MYIAGGGRRVAITAGTKTAPGYFFDYLAELVNKVKDLDAEILVCAPTPVADELSAATGVRVSWVPLDVLAPTCDLLIHHGGGGTALTGIACGVPQLLIPNMPKLVAPSARLARYGAATMILPGDDTPGAVFDAAADLLTAPSYRERARLLAQEVALMPAPAEVVGSVEKLA
jgi:glycosyltransferase